MGSIGVQSPIENNCYQSTEALIFVKPHWYIAENNINVSLLLLYFMSTLNIDSVINV